MGRCLPFVSMGRLVLIRLFRRYESRVERRFFKDGLAIEFSMVLHRFDTATGSFILSRYRVWES
jgi:hypothetical protein